MNEESGRESHFQIEVPKHIRDSVPARFGVEIIKPRPGPEADYFGDTVSVLISDQFSNKFIQSSNNTVNEFSEIYIRGLVEAFKEFLAKQKVA